MNVSLAADDHSQLIQEGPLHQDSQAFIDAMAANPGPAWDDISPAEARAGFAALTPVFGEGPKDVIVENVETDQGIALRIYRSPSIREKVTPVIVWFHGGGWVLGSIETHDALCRRFAKETGFAVASVDYRLSPEHQFPVPLNDCFSATTYIAENAKRLRIDPDKLIVAGDSAGGNLAAAVALKARNEKKPRIAAQVLIYPVLDRALDSDSYTKFATDHGLSRSDMEFFWKSYLPGNIRSQYAEPARAKSLQGLPPAIVVTAGYDVLRDEGLKYADRLKAAGVKVVQRHYPGMLHGFVHFAEAFSVGKTATKDLSKDIRSILK